MPPVAAAAGSVRQSVPKRRCRRKIVGRLLARSSAGEQSAAAAQLTKGLQTRLQVAPLAAYRAAAVRCGAGSLLRVEIRCERSLLTALRATGSQVSCGS